MSAPEPRDDEPRIHPTAELKGCRLGRHVAIGERVILREVVVGDYSYFERHGEAIYAVIGKFCSIAANCRINALEHPVERITTHKISYRPNEFFVHAGLDRTFHDRRKTKKVGIGHDVWIGHGAVVMPGVSIGNGAVIGANAVVTHDVGAYEVVAGVPARRLRLRFLARCGGRNRTPGLVGLAGRSACRRDRRYAGSIGRGIRGQMEWGGQTMCMMCGSPGAHGIMLSQRPAHRLFGKLWEGHHEAAAAYANHELIERVRVIARRNQGMWRSPIVSLGWNDRPETWRQFVGFAAEPGQSLPPECSEIELPEMEVRRCMARA
jgi:phosphonate metabolism protein (transferase hexapeptide repeat family)